MFQSAVIVALLPFSESARVKNHRDEFGDEFTERKCPTNSIESPCPPDHRLCVQGPAAGGCFPPGQDKVDACPAPYLCPVAGSGGHRHEDVVIDEAQLCPKKSPCPGGALFCPNDKGCYKPGEDKRCGAPLCSGKSGGGAVPPHTPPAPAPRQAPGPAPGPAPSAAGRWEPPRTGDILAPVDTSAPPSDVFPPNGGHYMPPLRVADDTPDVNTPHTNKFWANWISGKPNDGQKPVFSMPYSLQFTDADNGWKCHYYGPGQTEAWCKSHPREGNNEYNFLPGGTCGHCDCCRRVLEVRSELLISHNDPKVQYNPDSSARRGRIAYYISRFTPSYAMGMKEKTAPQHFAMDREDLTGVRVVIPKLGGGSIRFPVYRGMAYISGHYEGSTPRISSPQGIIRSMQKVQKGVFEFKNDEGHPDKLWECHYYQNGQSDGWCAQNNIIKGYEHSFFGDKKSPCGDCDCCKRPVGVGNKDYGKVYRAFVMDYGGNFIDGDFTNTSAGFVFSRPLSGWVRMAHIVEPKDAAVYQKHAPSILESMSVEIKSEFEFHYAFKRTGNLGVPHLHLGWRHQKKLMQNPNIVPESQVTHIRAPTKGQMVPLLGDRWILKIDSNPAKKMDLLPHTEPQGGYRNEVSAQLRKDIDGIQKCYDVQSWSTLECEGPRTWIFTSGFYTNGKGLQKLGTLCLMSQKLFGDQDAGTVACGNLLAKAFRCHSNPSSGCGGVPKAYYDTKWGGIASRQGFDNKMCGLADFGNACYNDHHYHYGYFIHAGAQLLQVKPDMRNDNGFVAYINSMIRDIANPSRQDKYFPQFRAFDWYDLHSWSHGVTPSSDGKDEESTSEDMNAYFGMQMWAKRVGHQSLERIASMQLSLLSHSASNLFLMKDGNEVHPKDYIKNRVTGIFFEAKVHYGTFFGADEVYIHGIQMLPLSPALRLARSKEFCIQEYNDILKPKGIPVAGNHAWSSLLITGNLALHDPHQAWNKLKGCSELDRGLSRSWAMYWIASLAAER